MGYEAALNKAWDELGQRGLSKGATVRFLADEYTLDAGSRRIISVSCNAPAKDFTAVLILHYAVASAAGLPQLQDLWVSFKELAGVEGYSAAFRKRSIEPVLRKYGANPKGLLSALDRLPGYKYSEGDSAIVLEAFKGVPVLVQLWKGDDEFGPEANMLFDKSISKIFCAEDIAVLGGFVAASV